MADVSSFVEKTISLLNIERKAEVDEARSIQENSNLSYLQKKGVCLLKLHVDNRCTGLYGRVLLTFGRARPGGVDCNSLPAHRITPGDIVGVSPCGSCNTSTEICSGIVSRVTQSAVIVAFDDSADTDIIDNDSQYRLNRLANDVTNKRIKSAMVELTKYNEGPAVHLISILFGSSDLGPPLRSELLDKYRNQDLATSLFFNSSLNESQRTAVWFALCQREVAVIHGPPGTGKTTTVVEIILQAVKNLGLKVLACAPSNIAVDNLVEKLAKSKAKVVRLGHPARVLPSIQCYSLDAILTASDATTIIQDVRKDIDKAMSKSRKSKDSSERRHLRQEIKTLRKELRQREDKAMKEILIGAEVVLATNTSGGNDGPLGRVPVDHFDLVVIDEAAQALEASCWIPLLRAPRCILSGDHHQLPPTIVSPEAAKKGLDVTLMERVVKQYGDKVVHMLTTQYRMHESIMQWSSDQLYQGRLQADTLVQYHLLKDLPNVQETEETTLPLLLIDTAGCDVTELEVEEEVSKGNEGEADIVSEHVTALINAGLDARDIAVIAPYNLQVELLRMRLSHVYPTLEIRSVDGFQGREKEAVVISLVRSNKQGIVGFLAEDRRINVAITRARRHLAVICDSETVSHHPFLKSLVTYMADRGEVRSAMEYLHGNIVAGDVTSIDPGSAAISVRSALGTSGSHKGELTSGKSKNERNKKDKKKDQVLENTAKEVVSDSKIVNKQTFEGCNDLNFEKNSSKFEENRNSNLNITDGTSVVRHLSDEGTFLASDVTTFENGDVTSTQSNRQVLTKEQLEVEIRQFLLAEGTEHVFSPDLTAQERFFVHSIAEEVNLEHESKGGGSHRHIVVRKKLPQPVIDDDDLLSTCKLCKKRLPTCNMELHLLRCEQQHKHSQQSQSTAQAEKTNDYEERRLKSKKKKPSKSQTSSSAVRHEEDFDAMLAEFTKKDTRCAFTSCKQSITMLGQECRCCSKVFCLSHHIPEVHGCGAQAKLLSRKGLGKSEPPRPRKSDATRKAQLHRKLENKLENMSDKRKHKKKDNK